MLTALLCKNTVCKKFIPFSFYRVWDMDTFFNYSSDFWWQNSNLDYWNYCPTMRWLNNAPHKTRDIVLAIKLTWHQQWNTHLLNDTWNNNYTSITCKKISKMFKIFMCINWNVCFVLPSAHTQSSKFLSVFSLSALRTAQFQIFSISTSNCQKGSLSAV